MEIDPIRLTLVNMWLIVSVTFDRLYRERFCTTASRAKEITN